MSRQATPPANAAAVPTKASASKETGTPRVDRLQIRRVIAFGGSDESSAGPARQLLIGDGRCAARWAVFVRDDAGAFGLPPGEVSREAKETTALAQRA
jgi:hypothetical protein